MITYKGNCDVIRLQNYNWSDFQENELIIGKQYEIIDSCNMQYVYIKDQNGNVIVDHSGQRYRYFKIKNEQNELIYIWDGFFNDNKIL